MKITIMKECLEYERRVAATPETVKKYIAMGFDVAVEAGAGLASRFTDVSYENVGAVIAASPAEALKDADIVLRVRCPVFDGQQNEFKGVKPNALLIGLLSPYEHPNRMKPMAEAGLSAFAMEFIPRISRAQSMDVLSSQSNLAGYRAVIDATQVYQRAMPMMMTAAGTVAPAKVMVLGAGVAGLQAIATARRLGAVVCATDVRPAAKEQVQSLGAKFVMVESEEAKAAETAGGYAKEMSEDFKKQQAELVAKTIATQDIVICTALIPGRKAPQLISESMVKSMRPGSVIVDLAVEQGGNCALSQVGEIVDVEGVSIVGHCNVPSRICTDASSLYAKNLLHFIHLLCKKDEDKLTLNIDLDDDIIKASLLTHDGSVVHPHFIEPEPVAKSPVQPNNQTSAA